MISEEPNGILHAQAILQRVDSTYRGEIIRMAGEDEDHRVRTMTVDFLTRSKTPPPEEFFINLLDLDDHEGPREKAAFALERYGTENALQVLDRVMNEETDKKLRFRAARAASVISRRARLDIPRR